jgi:glycosyltransferase involved in cell wall biosynthesis
MVSQLESGLEVRAISPIDNHIAPNRRQDINHMAIREFDSGRADFAALAADESRGARTIFHFHGITPWSDTLAKCLIKQGTPYAFTSHGQLHHHGLIHGFKKLVYLNLLNPFIRNASGLHFLTQQEFDRSRFILPFWRRPVLIQPNLVEIPAIEEIVPASRTQFDIPADAFVFAYLGRLDVRHKGLDYLIEAFAEICRASSAHLLLIGPDFAGGQNFLEQRARQLGCEKKVHFAGPQNGVAKWEFLKMANAFVSPSRWEAFGIALAEALGIGLPTVISDQMNITNELVTRGAAVACPLSSVKLTATMQRLMTNEALRTSLSAAGHQWVIQACASVNAGPRFRNFYQSL